MKTLAEQAATEIMGWSIVTMTSIRWYVRDPEDPRRTTVTAVNRGFDPEHDARDWMRIVERMRELPPRTFAKFVRALVSECQKSGAKDKSIVPLEVALDDEPIMSVLWYINGTAIIEAALAAVRAE